MHILLTEKSVIEGFFSFFLTFAYVSYGLSKALHFLRCYLGYLAIHCELRIRPFHKRNPDMKKLIFALIAGITVAGAAQAQAPRSYVGVGVASADHDLRIGGLGNPGSDGYKASAKIFGGVELTPMFGVEAGYTHLSDADHTFTIGNTAGRATTDGSRSYLAGKATMPVSDAFSVYGKLGAGYSKVNLKSSTPLISRDDSKTELYGAIGGQFNLNEKVALTLEYERYGKKKDYGVKADAITAGAKFSF